MSIDAKSTVTQWLNDAKSGDEQAVEKIWERYFSRLVGLARNVLAKSGAASGREEDIAQSAFKSFYFRARDGKFPRLSDRDGLWKLLMTITLRKAFRVRQRESKGGSSLDPEVLAAELAAESPSPDMAVTVTDEFSRLFGLLDNPQLSAVALMKLEGLTNQRIADSLDISIATVERKLQLIRQLWADELEG